MERMNFFSKSCYGFLQYPISNFILGIFVTSTVFIVRLCRFFTGFTKTLTNSSFHIITSFQELLYQSATPSLASTPTWRRYQGKKVTCPGTGQRLEESSADIGDTEIDYELETIFSTKLTAGQINQKYLLIREAVQIMSSCINHS